MEEYNTVIIGSGIAGMTAAIYLKRAGINTLIIEREMPGGQLSKACTIENYPGYENISGSVLALNIYSQLNSYNPDYLSDEVLKVDFTTNTIITSTKTIKYKYLIIATGRSSKKLEIPNEEKYIGRGISFCASCDGALYKNKEVIVVGGANSAISEALYLSNICKKVTIIYRKEELRGEEILKERINNTNNIEIINNTNITEYIIENNKVIGVKLSNNKEIKADCIFLAIGYIPNSNIFSLEKTQDGYIITNEKCQTNIPNVYACGDIIKKELYQLVTSSSEGAIAASSIINQNKEL